MVMPSKMKKLPCNESVLWRKVDFDLIKEKSLMSMIFEEWGLF
jgi:hypothetical protein